MEPAILQSCSQDSGKTAKIGGGEEEGGGTAGLLPMHEHKADSDIASAGAQSGQGIAGALSQSRRNSTATAVNEQEISSQGWA